MTATITLDQIIAASDASGIPIADLIKSIDEASTIAAKPAPTMRKRTSQPKADSKRDWKTGPATIGQQRRIPRAEEAILESGRKRGIALILRGEARERAMATGGSASAYYNTLATFTRKHGIKF
jgi:hypothetical protein